MLGVEIKNRILKRVKRCYDNGKNSGHRNKQLGMKSEEAESKANQMESLEMKKIYNLSGTVSFYTPGFFPFI